MQFLLIPEGAAFAPERAVIASKDGQQTHLMVL